MTEKGSGDQVRIIRYCAASRSLEFRAREAASDGVEVKIALHTSTVKSSGSGADLQVLGGELVMLDSWSGGLPVGEVVATSEVLHDLGDEYETHAIDGDASTRRVVHPKGV